MTDPGPGAAGRGSALRRLGRLRARARAALFWEALWPRLWPVLGVVGVFLVLALSGVFLLLHPLPHLLLLGVLTGALVVAVLHGLRGLSLPDLPPGALVAFLDAGAYGATMSSSYNARPLAAEVMVDGHRWAVTRPRQSHEALLAGQIVPDWLGRTA